MSERYGPKHNGGMASATHTPATDNAGGVLVGGTGDRAKAFDEQGAVGKQFTEQGAIGGTAQKLGGPFDKEGAIGKQFTTEGSIGGTVQQNLGGQK